MNEEIPLSNHEVYKILSARKGPMNEKTESILQYLKSINCEKTSYPLEKLREMKFNRELESDIIKLTMASNSNDTSILSENDENIIRKNFPGIQ